MNDEKIVFQHGGTYEANAADLVTTTDFAGKISESFIGKMGPIKLDIDGNTLGHIDPDAVFNETFRRVRKLGAKSQALDRQNQMVNLNSR